MKKILSIGIIAIVLLINSITFGAEKDLPVTFDQRHKDGQFIFLLYDIEVKVNEKWAYTTKVHKKLKVLKEESRDMGEIPIYYENDREKVRGIQAFTITPDNKKYKYTKIQDFKLYDGYPMYSDSMAKIITLPEVAVGSILEHEYTITSKGFPLKNAFWETFAVDSTEPVKEFRLSITMPKSLGIKNKEFGLTRKPKIRESKSSITYSWILNDLDGTKEDEDYLPPPNPESFPEIIEFSSINGWRDISDWYFSLIQKNLKINPKIEAAAKKAIAGHNSLKDKTRAVLEYLQDNFRYVSMSLGDNALEPHSTDEVFKNKYGDCKDLSLLGMALLKIAGINSRICLFNKEYSISDPKYDLPIPSLFDHVLLLVEDPPEGDFYADPLLDGYDIGEYPLEYQGAYTFIITADGGKLSRFPVFDEKSKYTAVKRDISIEEDGSALIEAEILWDLDSSIGQRRRLKAMDKKDKEQFYQALDTSLAGGGEILERRINGLEQKYGTLKAYSKIKRKDEFSVTDGIMVIDMAGYDRGVSFAKKERKKPIFYPLNSWEEEVIAYHIPPGYSISYVPPDLNLDIGFFSLKREYIKGEREIKVKETTRYQRMQLPKEEYAQVRDFYDHLPSKTQQRIMVKKIQNSQKP